MEKEIKLLDKNTINIDISEAYSGTGTRITKRYFKDGEYVKDFCLAMWDDYGFDAWVDDIETLQKATSLYYLIPSYDPLYLCFLEFLGNLNEIIIDSDDVNELNKKTLTIRKKENDVIELIFENLLEVVKKAVSALEDKKAEDITVIDIGEISSIADYFIIANGSNANQLTAMQEAVDEAFYKAGFQAKQIEGNRNSTWILIDYNDVIVHLFSKEDRLFYDLERIWKDGKVLDLSEL